MLQLKIPHTATKIPHATAKTHHRQINKYFLIKKSYLSLKHTALLGILGHKKTQRIIITPDS